MVCSGRSSCYAFRAVLAKNGENTGSIFVELHFGHLIRLRSRSVMAMVNENIFLQLLQRNS